MLWIIFGLIITLILYLYLTWPFNYWSKKGIHQISWKIVLKNSTNMLLRRESPADINLRAYSYFPNKRYYGFYNFSMPTLFITNPDLIKQITVKDFDHFLDHYTFFPEDIDPLWGKNLFALTGQRWRDMRSTLSPAFTSSKMKYMFSLISQSGEQFTKYFLKWNEKVIEIEMKDTFTRFTNDVIANIAFGIECDSLENRDNEFYLMGKEATSIQSFWKGMKMFLHLFFPKLARHFGTRLFSEEVSTFFINLVRENIASREKQGIVRPDMINLLMEARKHGLKHEEAQPEEDAGFATVQESEIGKNPRKTTLTDEDITAQALIFFFAGFESVSAIMCFVAYELAINPDIQRRLIEEIDSCNGKLTYEALLGMKYLDMVLSETLRKWPITVGVDRVCTKPYTIEPKNPDEVPLHLDKSMGVWFPILGLHRDPEYYPDPDRFDPERFNDENKANIKPYTYLPFGSGPRNCIGSRFALLETKALFFHILSNFEIVPTKKSVIPVRLSKSSFALGAENGMWLGFKRRSNK